MQLDYWTRHWYSASVFHFSTLLLLPFSWLFQLLVWVRSHLYRWGILRIYFFPVPVIVIGNVTVGGTGKTPLVMWVAHYLKAQGYSPGIVTRGIGSKKPWRQPHRVNAQDVAEDVGDEAILLCKKSDSPVVVGIDRVAAIHFLLQQVHCDVIISDDGLQHYRMDRDIEIAVVDGARRFGNQLLLPAGPLREPVSRLKKVDFVMVNGGGGAQDQNELRMMLQPVACVAVRDPEKKMAMNYFVGKKVHAVAAIGHPQRFFQMLVALGYDIIPHVFPDHYLYRREDLNFKDDLPILMTEKDAVKCEAFADEQYWYVSVGVIVSENFQQDFTHKLANV